MALSQSVNDSLDEAESNLRNALAYAARQEKPFVCNIIAEMITKIDSMKQMDNIMDKGLKIVAKETVAHGDQS